MTNFDFNLCYIDDVQRGAIVDHYIMNEKTLAVIGIDYKFCRILEENEEFLISKSWQDILDESCLYYSSSFQGRVDGSRTLLNKEYKVPIILQEMGTSIFFPVGNQTNYNCMWISLKNLNYYTSDKTGIHLFFQGNKDLLLTSGVQAFESQLLKSYNLEKLFISRQKNL